MRKVHFYLGTGFIGAYYEGFLEFPDNITDEEIEERYERWKSEKLDCQWWDEE